MSQALTEETDEIFLQTLYRGSELIGKGDLEAAREALESAVEMRPDDAKARNLLGLACFKLADYPAAESLYQALVDENADDATLRVNLGLVHLKNGRFEDAIRELALAVEMQPDHRRAQNYLGLAYARVGDYAQAQECFRAAGSPQMVEKMEKLMAGDEGGGAEAEAAAPDAPPKGAGRLDAPSNGEQRRWAEDGGEAPEEDAGSVAEAGGGQSASSGEDVGGAGAQESDAALDRDEASDSFDDEGREEDGGSPPAGGVGDLGEAAADASNGAGDFGADPSVSESAPEMTEMQTGGYAPTVSSGGYTTGEALASPLDGSGDGWEPSEDYADHPEEPDAPAIEASKSSPAAVPQERWVLPARLLELADAAALPGQIPAPFAVSPDVVVAAVDREMLTRARGLLAIDGRLDLRPEVKRFRGRATEKPFGEGDGRVLRVSGRGRLFLATRGRSFTPVRIDGTDAYLQEDGVFAFEETVAYENGRVPSKVSPDLHLVHLRGRGVVLLESEGKIVSTQVTPGVPLRVPLERLIGWTGLVTPRIVEFADEGGADGGPLTGIELAGEGRVLISLPSSS